MERKPNPRNALDYPNIDDSRFVIWHSNGIKWPDARRSVSYLSVRKRDVMKGFALFSIFWSEAENFATEGEAQAFLADHNAKRIPFQPYHGVQVTTVADLKRQCGYEES